MKKRTVLAGLLGIAGMAGMMATTPQNSRVEPAGRHVTEQSGGMTSERSDSTATNENRVQAMAIEEAVYRPGNVYGVHRSNYSKWCNSVGCKGVNKIKRSRNLRRKHRR